MARSDETYPIDGRGANTTQRSYREAQQVY